MAIRFLPWPAAAPALLLILAGGAAAAPDQGPAAAAAPATVPATESATVPEPAKMPAPAAAKAARPAFTGQWRLDPKASDDPMQQMAAGDGPDGGHNGGGRPPQLDPNQGKVPGEGFDGSDAPDKARAEAAGREATREFSELEIFLDGDEFNLTDGMQITRVLRIGGAPTEVFTPRGMVRAGAAWEGDTLVVTELSPEGSRLCTRQLRLTDGGATLSVREIRHQSGKDGDRTMVMVYRRQGAGSRP